MSVLLYRLGVFLSRRRGLVVGGWLLVLLAVVGSSTTLGNDFDDSFTVPGTQSQEGLDLIRDRFGQSGTSGQVIFTAAAGAITGSANARAVKRIAAAVDAVPGAQMSDPLGPPPGQKRPVLASDKRSTLGQVLFDDVDPTEETLAAVVAAARPPSGSGITTSVGGNAYKASAPPSRVPELIGLGVSFLILALTFGSLITAGMPILSALVGVGVTISAVVLASNVASVSSASPNLAEMLGLAVGIDYALFLLSRYRRQLRDPGITPAVAMSRALATAGSAVVFAGSTVIIALTGLAVARIPVLTVMGLAAAAAVAVAVTVALTLLPAIALLLGERLRPRTRRRTPRRRRWRRARKPAAQPDPPSPAPSRERVPLSMRWIALVTGRPLLTILVVASVLLLAAVPASRLELALPDNSSAPEGTAPRQTYDDITDAFGEGYNAPLTITAGVITSDDPVGTVNKLATALGKLPGVVAVTQATPNESADTALIQVIPTAGQTAPSTARLVGELRDHSAELEQTYGVTDMLVTGPTAVNIDVSERLGASLLPFAAIVIGLSLLLLMIVFRSVAVPLKATLGYLLSVGAALGAVVVVFQWGWLGAVAGGDTGPVVSFLPIFVMGVLFGLAMDYEMFLVSAMREAYVGSGDARAAVRTGFRASSIVVTAAALIMTSVFLTFVPDGSTTIKPIAFGLAVGVFVDAFAVRMTFVPAVLVLLGSRAWWLPGWLDRRVPAVDVEGAAMHRKVAYEDWEKTHGTAALVARDLVVRPGGPSVSVEAPPGEVTRLVVPDGVDPADLARALVGRLRPVAGDLVVGGLLLPEQREAVLASAACVDVGPPDGRRADGRPADDRSPEARVVERSRLSAFGRRARSAFAERALDRVEALDGVAAPYAAIAGPAGRAAIRDAVVEAALALAGGVRLLVLVQEDPESPVPPGAAEALARRVAAGGVTAVLLRPPPWRLPAALHRPPDDAAHREPEEARP
ncbi:MMPL family transporter [Nocardioides sp. GY 10113]|uniref:MMPL family transporter n=1 Tax=Nocardioides sp. GY 10113 TaxID=2569761 RepID=UPI0010A7F86B|nr:MMPL family transporter [Nocardioides sp. GY 10113]TIC88266.1 MMPL family transporter [Nocardioides sp. GY 10113]